MIENDRNLQFCVDNHIEKEYKESTDSLIFLLDSLLVYSRNMHTIYQLKGILIPAMFMMFQLCKHRMSQSLVVKYAFPIHTIMMTVFCWLIPLPQFTTVITLPINEKFKMLFFMFLVWKYIYYWCPCIVFFFCHSKQMDQGLIQTISKDIYISCYPQCSWYEGCIHTPVNAHHWPRAIDLLVIWTTLPQGQGLTVLWNWVKSWV